MPDSRLRDLFNTAPHTHNRAQRRNAEKLLKAELRRIENMRIAERLSGAGYPIDNQLRSLLDSCNDERLQGAAEPFAKIWDVYSGFVRDEPSDLISFLRLRPEKDHAYTQSDFFAFLPEDSIRDATIPALMALPEGVIHNYTAIGDVKEVLFEQAGEEPVTAAGLSVIRHGQHLHWMVIGGPVTDLAARSEERRRLLKEEEERIRRVNAGAAEDRLRNILNPSAVAYPETDDVWLSFAMGLFNLETAAHEIRTLVRDWGVSLAVFSDQFEQRYTDVYDKDEDVRRMVDKAVTELEANRLFFDMAESLLSLPAYFNTRVELISQHVRQTELSPSSQNQNKRFGMKAPLDMRILTRNVASLDFGRQAALADRLYAPPQFEVEVEGFWRRLQQGSMGRDANGNPIAGRTWVKSHARWKDRPKRPKTVHMKSSLAAALSRAERTVAQHGGSYSMSSGNS